VRGAALLAKAAYLLAVAVAKAGWQKALDIAAQHLLGRDAEHHTSGRVEQHDAHRVVHRDDGVHRRLDQPVQLLPTLDTDTLRPAALRHIDKGGDHLLHLPLRAQLRVGRYQ
jgi:hypothetical protein